MWARIDRCVVGDNENVYFFKGVSVDRTSVYIPLLAKTSKLNYKHEIHATAPEARFSKVPIITDP